METRVHGYVVKLKCYSIWRYTNVFWWTLVGVLSWDIAMWPRLRSSLYEMHGGQLQGIHHDGSPINGYQDDMKPRITLVDMDIFY